MSGQRRVLILGGARFHGFQVADYLARNGNNEVFVLNRGNYRSNYHTSIKCLLADRNDPNSLKSALGNYSFDAVIDNNAYKASHIDIILNLMKGRYEQYIFVSTAAVYLKHTSRKKIREEANGLLKEMFSPLVLNYAREKFFAEEFLRNHSKDHNFTIIRPPNIFGEGDFLGKLAYFYYRLKDGGKILLEEEIDEFSLIYVKDVVKALVSILGNRRCFGKTLNIADPIKYDYKSFFSSIYDNFSMEKILMISAEKMWSYGYSIPFVWGPLLDTTAFDMIFSEFNYTPLKKWGRESLCWELENMNEKFNTEEFKRVRELELAIIREICK